MDARHDETSLADLIESQGESIGLGLGPDEVRMIVAALREKYDRRKLFELRSEHAKVPTPTTRQRVALHEDDGA
jgi:hypothetical protein